MTSVLAIDAGTTGVRTVAVDAAGRVTARAYREFAQHFPHPGWVEHDAEEIWQATLSTLAEVAASLDGPVAALGITNQRETVVAWDRRSGDPLHRAIVWQDRRTADRCDELVAAGMLPRVRATTGLVLDPYFSATKIAWLHETGGVRLGPGTAVGTIDSWIVHRLTRGTVHITDTTNASRTMLADLATTDWSPEMLDAFGIARSVLPDVVASSGRVATVAGGLPFAGVPISGIAGDQQAALFGQACFEPGMAKNTYGTGSFVLMNCGDTCPEPVDGLLNTIAWTLDDAGGRRTTYALEGAIFVTGAAIQWLRDGLGIIDDAAAVGPLAESCDDTGGVYLVPAFTGLGSPWWDPDARGTIVGLTRGTGRAELARAAVEAMAHQTRDVVDAMVAASGRPLSELRVDGGASVLDLLLRLQADQLGVPVTRSAVAETTALGAAYLAGLAEGVWDSPADVAANWHSDARVDPVADRDPADAAHRDWRRAVERSQHWARS